MVLLCSLSKCHCRLHYVVFRLFSKWSAWLFVDVAKIDKAFMCYNLIHVLYSIRKVHFVVNRLDLHKTLLVGLRHVFFVSFCTLCAEFTFDNIYEWVRYMVFAWAHPTYKTRSTDYDLIDRSESEIRLETVHDKWLHVDHEVQPDAFQKHRARNPSVALSLHNIVFAVNVLRSSWKVESSLHHILVCEDYLQSERVFAHNFDLKKKVRLQQEKFLACTDSAWDGELGRGLADKHVAFYVFIESFLKWSACHGPFLDRLFFLDWKQMYVLPVLVLILQHF